MRLDRNDPRRAARWAVAWLGLALLGCEPRATNAPAGAPEQPLTEAPTAPGPAPADPPRSGMGIVDERLQGFVPPPPSAQEPSPFRFREVAREAGVDFVHVSGMTPERHFPTANGSGVAVFDYDGDGDMDLYFATGTLLPPGKARTGPNRLYENLGGGKFREATAASGLGFEGYCHGIIVGDVDNDGDQDVFLANYAQNALFLNDGHGKFTDVSREAGVLDPPGWSSGGAFLDSDGDGDLDLYVSRYGEWKLPEDDKPCIEHGVRMYCSPKTIRTVRHILYRNTLKETGRLGFVDVTESAGVSRAEGQAYGHGFGVVTADVNGDGKTDIYVANDMNPNFLFLNKGDGTFEDATESSGAALNKDGRALSGMGVEAEDVDGDGLPDLFVTNFQNEANTLYQSLGGGLFQDQSAYFNLSIDSLPWVKWGCALADFDNDGWPDCFVTNGHVDNNHKGPPNYAQPPLLHKNEGGKRFRLATRDAGPYFAGKHLGRGAAVGDLDDDGRLDIVVNHKDGPPAVLLNRTEAGGRWVRLKLVGTASNRDAVGARGEVVVRGRTIHRQRKGGASMLSSSDPRLLIGLGDAPEVVKLTVRWPYSDRVTTREHLAPGQTYEIVEGGGDPAAPSAGGAK